MATYIANRTPQCPPVFRSESHKVYFLKQAVMDQTWASSILVRINPATEFQSLYTELANALQLHQEMKQRQGITSAKPGPLSKSSKPFIYFIQPRVVKYMAKAMFPGNENVPECWNCGSKGHRFTKFHKELNLTKIVAKKAEYFAKKGNKKYGAKRVLYELASGLSELCKIDSEVSDYAKAFFGDIIDEDDTLSTSSSDSEPEELSKDSMFTTTEEAASGTNQDSDSIF